MENSLLKPVKITKAKSKPKEKILSESKLHFSKKFSELHDLNKDFITYMKNDKKWQKHRKQFYKVSNFLDNYYNQFHSRPWYPNGKYQVKIRYNHTESGLEHIYEKNNVEQLVSIDKISKDKNRLIDPKNFIELEKSKPGDYIIVIEYCSSCEEHSNITQHSSDTIYKDLALKYQKIINERFPFIKVLLKPIDVDIVKNMEVELPEVEVNGGQYKNTKSVNSYFKECRIGAFEIYIMKYNKEVKIVHSKLNTKKFPKVNNVLDKIVAFLPKFKLNLILYDKEDYEDLDKMNDIQVNIYLCQSNIIKQVRKSTEEQVLNFTSPKRRLDMLRLQRLSSGQNFFKNGRSLLFNSRGRISSSIPKHNNRGFSAISSSVTERPMTSVNHTEKSEDKNEIINNEIENSSNWKEMLKSQKGYRLETKFSKVENDEKINSEEDDRSESVAMKFENLPYDTYIIETVENCYFESSWTLLKFNEINYDSNNEVTKYIGLWHQKKAILNIHLYMKKEISKDANGNNDPKTNLDFEVINDANVTISKADDPNSRYKVYPNDRSIYEYMASPGEYKLEIIKDNCERVVEKIKIQSGLNTKNIELFPAKHCDLVVQVLEYNEYDFKKNDIQQMDKNEEKSNIITTPIRNAEVQIFKNSDELLVEGITNRKGLMTYLVDKNSNNLTIKVNKHGYFRAERFFKKNNTMKENEKGNYDCLMTFVLVKKEILENCKKVLFVLYSNMCKSIFDLNVQKYENEEDDDFCHYYTKDMQQKSGILISSLWYNPQKREDDELILEENLTDDKKVNEINEEKKNEMKGKKEKQESQEDFDESTTYKEIVRIGLNINPEILLNEKGNVDINDITSKDLIDYLRDICCEGNIYTPKYDFHINLPKILSDISINEISKESKTSENESKALNNTNKSEKKEFNGLYWDLGWLDLKNKLYYETSCHFDINKTPERLAFFEKFVDFLQVFIDKKIYDSLFSYFGYNNSILAGSDRYITRKVFMTILDDMLIDENNNIEKDKAISTKRNNERKKEKMIFMEFVCNILCGYDEEMNIKDDSVSFNLLRKKISSNLKNFDGINEVENNENK